MNDAIRIFNKEGHTEDALYLPSSKYIPDYPGNNIFAQKEDKKVKVCDSDLYLKGDMYYFLLALI